MDSDDEVELEEPKANTGAALVGASVLDEVALSNPPKDEGAVIGTAGVASTFFSGSFFEEEPNEENPAKEDAGLLVTDDTDALSGFLNSADFVSAGFEVLTNAKPAAAFGVALVVEAKGLKDAAGLEVAVSVAGLLAEERNPN